MTDTYERCSCGDCPFGTPRDRAKCSKESLTGSGKVCLKVKPEDLEISIYPPYKVGGQHVGLTHSGVLVVHVPTGLGVVSISERSQYRNRERAMIMLEFLIELET